MRQPARDHRRRRRCHTSTPWPSSRAPRTCRVRPSQIAEWRAQRITPPIRFCRFPRATDRSTRACTVPTTGSSRRAVTLVPGVHMDGIRESRLVGMAEDLAASGFTVLTVASPDLQRFRITPESTDIIEDAARLAGVRPERRATRSRRQDRHARHQLLRRAVDRRRRTSAPARQGQLRHVVWRPRRPAARDAIPLLGQRARDAAAWRRHERCGRRRARDHQAAARLRRRGRAAPASPITSSPPIRSNRFARAS